MPTRWATKLFTRRKCGLIGLLAVTVLCYLLIGNPKKVTYLASALNRTSLGEIRENQILAEFRLLARQVSVTVEEFGEKFLRKQKLARHRQCSQGLVSRQHCSCFESNARNRILFILPVRNRWKHVSSLLQKLLPLLEKQRVCYLISIVEQTQHELFNKGLLMNAAVVEAVDAMPFFDCVIFHDVDLLPTSEDVRYHCSTFPYHMSVKVDKFHKKLPYLGLIGGVLAIPVNHFLRVNGYSNMFWGWGAEDDDLFERLSFVGIPVTRSTTAEYSMIPHEMSAESDPWRKNALLSLSLKRYRMDGLNSLRYRLESKELMSALRFLNNTNATVNRLIGRYIKVLHMMIDPIKPDLDSSPFSKQQMRRYPGKTK